MPGAMLIVEDRQCEVFGGRPNNYWKKRLTNNLIWHGFTLEWLTGYRLDGITTVYFLALACGQSDPTGSKN